MATCASDDNIIKGDEESSIGNSLPQEPPPPYQPQAPSYGTGGDPVPPAYDPEPPPSYESVFGQVKAAKQQSSSTAEFFKRFIIILLGTLGCTICVGLVLAIPVSMIAMGSYYVHDCPREHYIPIYLIVAGVFGVLKNLSNITQRIKNKQSDQEDDNIKTNPFDGTLSCFLLAWFIAGNVWIYRIYNDYSTDPSHPHFCDPVLYQFAFWMTTSIYILVFVVTCCFCCVGGNVWIFRVYNDYNPYDVRSPRYCNPILYTYAFWITTSVYIMAALSCCCFCFAGLIAVFTGSKD